MKTSTRLLVLGTLLAASSVAGAQTYGPVSYTHLRAHET